MSRRDQLLRFHLPGEDTSILDSKCFLAGYDWQGGLHHLHSTVLGSGKKPLDPLKGEVLRKFHQKNQDVTGYPTLKFFKSGAEKEDGVKYRGNRCFKEFMFIIILFPC